MAQGYVCDQGHDPAVPAVSMVTLIESGDAVTYCAFCLLEWCWAMVEADENFDAKLQQRIVAMLETEENRKSAAAKRARRKERAEGEPKDSALIDQAAESTVTE